MFDCQVYLCGHGETKDFTVQCLLNAVRTSVYKYNIAYQSGDALIGRSRSVACTRFLKDHQADYMIFIDTDITFTKDELDKLLVAMMAGYDIVGGAYSVASGDRLAIRGWDANITIDGRILDVEYVSTGFFGISRKALELMRDKCPVMWVNEKGIQQTQIGLPLLHKGEWCECYPFFESGATNLEKGELFYISEDWDFCNKARKVGLKVYFHSGCLVDHVKLNIINAEQMLQAHSTPNAVQVHPEVRLINDIAEFTNKSFDEIQSAILDYKVKGNKTDYEWLIELAQFNSFAYYDEQRLSQIMGFAGLRILDYGCGIGTAAIKLAGKNAVIGYDNNKYLIDFCSYRVKKNGLLNIGFTNEEPDLSQFDLLFCIDVLEHFQDLESFIKHLGEKMRSGAKLYHFDAFFDHVTPGHFDHSAKIDEYLKSAGFVIFNPLWAVKI